MDTSPKKPDKPIRKSVDIEEAPIDKNTEQSVEKTVSIEVTNEEKTEELSEKKELEEEKEDNKEDSKASDDDDKTPQKPKEDCTKTFDPSPGQSSGGQGRGQLGRGQREKPSWVDQVAKNIEQIFAMFKKT